MGRYLLLALLFAAALLPSAAAPAEATVSTEVRIFPPVKYVAESAPTFSVDVRAESVVTYELHIGYDETNVDTDDLTLGADPVVAATYAETNVDTDLAFGNEEASEQRAQGFQVAEAGPVNRILLWLKKTGTPIDGVAVEIRADSGGLPDVSGGGLLSGSAVASGETDIDTSSGWVGFDLLSPPDLSPGTQYHLVVKRTSPLGPDPDDYYQWGGDTSSPAYADGSASAYDGSSETWAATVPAADHAFVVDTAAAERAQGFQVGSDSPVNRVLLWLKRVGDLTGDDGSLRVEIRDDSGGLPGALLATSLPLQISALETTYDWYAFDLISPPEVSAAMQYHVVLIWLDDPEAANYVVWGADSSSPGYADGAAAAYYGGSTWVPPSPEADHAFEVAYACPLDPNDPTGDTGPCGLGAFDIQILFDTSDFQYESMNVGPLLTSTGRASPICQNGLAHDPLNGVVAYSCSTTGATPLGPHSASGVLATATFTALGSGGFLNLGDTVLADIKNASIPHTTQGNQVIVEDFGTDDTDGDGCTDLQETGGDLMLGGQRNPHDPYDFYDVPVPAIADPTPNGARNAVVDIGDVLAVLFYAFADDNGPPNSNGVDYDSMKGSCSINNVPGQEEGLCYDRTAVFPLSGAPNGAIDIGDVLAVLGQFTHDCT